MQCSLDAKVSQLVVYLLSVLGIQGIRCYLKNSQLALEFPKQSALVGLHSGFVASVDDCSVCFVASKELRA